VEDRPAAATAVMAPAQRPTYHCQPSPTSSPEYPDRIGSAESYALARA